MKTFNPFFRIMSTVMILCIISCKEKSKITEPNEVTNEEEINSIKPTDGKIHIMKPEEGDLYWFNPSSKDTLGTGGELTIYIDAETYPDASASFAKFTMGVGGTLPTHKHTKTEEIAYIVSGEGLAINIVDEKLIEIPIKAGYVWYNPPAVWHSFKNTGSEPLSLVFAVIPNEKKGLLSFFRKIGVEPGKEATALSPEEFGKLASEHDMILKPAKEID